MKTSASRAFTLIEMLLAVALMGALLAALNMFIFSMGEIWGRNSEQRLFDQHVRAVTRYVGELLRRAALAPEALAATTHTIAPQEVRSDSGASDNLLTFTLPDGDRTLPWPDTPLPDVVCSLNAVDGKGLLLCWHSRLETRFADEPARTTVLTPFVTSLSYDYYQKDLKSWQTQTRLQTNSDGKWEVPDRLTLHFVHGKLTADTTVALTGVTDGLPPF